MALPSEARQWPRVGVYDAGAEWVVYAEVPGLCQGDLQLVLGIDTLTISGERRTTIPEGYRVHLWERKPGHFARTIQLPSAIVRETVEAHVQNGLLTIRLAKLQRSAHRQTGRLPVIASGGGPR